MVKIFKKGKKTLGENAFSTSIVKILEDKCGENLRAKNFPAYLEDSENKKDGIEVLTDDKKRF